MEQEIKRTLSVGNADIDKCIAVMEELNNMTIEPVMLQKNPAILKTIKMCRRYKGDSRVQKKSELIYNRFKTMFMVGEGENFSEVFRKAKDKYQKEQKERDAKEKQERENKENFDKDKESPVENKEDQPDLPLTESVSTEVPQQQQEEQQQQENKNDNKMEVTDNMQQSIPDTPLHSLSALESKNSQSETIKEFKTQDSESKTVIPGLGGTDETDSKMDTTESPKDTGPTKPLESDSNKIATQNGLELESMDVDLTASILKSVEKESQSSVMESSNFGFSLQPMPGLSLGRPATEKPTEQSRSQLAPLDERLKLFSTEVDAVKFDDEPETPPEHRDLEARIAQIIKNTEDGGDAAATSTAPKYEAPAPVAPQPAPVVPKAVAPPPIKQTVATESEDDPPIDDDELYQMLGI
ncbi:myb-like protein X [Lingula anatina]|uniref:Myb-like protein X n=1 Tax=Lingula anatina TaxID=7574 RepID=A0A1S3I2G1_LINAN|nr:myb-like protein X [Lingula anatina]|eukprot:XP_013392433.1 myb-like protein X [Lingula anatina]